MKSKTFFALLSPALLIALMIGCSDGKAKEQVADVSAENKVERGDYLVTVMGCHDCHSPKKIDAQGASLIPEMLLSGYHSSPDAVKPDPSCIKGGWVLITMDLTTAAGPWGVSYSANLTSDQSGIGNWTLENFKRALKEGKFKGIENGRTLLPPMPWTNFVNIADEDVDAIFTYLQHTTPVANVVPPPLPPNEM